MMKLQLCSMTDATMCNGGRRKEEVKMEDRRSARRFSQSRGETLARWDASSKDFPLHAKKVSTISEIHVSLE